MEFIMKKLVLSLLLLTCYQLQAAESQALQDKGFDSAENSDTNPEEWTCPICSEVMLRAVHSTNCDIDKKVFH